MKIVFRFIVSYDNFIITGNTPSSVGFRNGMTIKIDEYFSCDVDDEMKELMTLCLEKIERARTKHEQPTTFSREIQFPEEKEIDSKWNEPVKHDVNFRRAMTLSTTIVLDPPSDNPMPKRIRKEE